ncbi:MAG: hypothetical protein QM731_09805 [Chitinophagaceae bacterium]
MINKTYRSISMYALALLMTTTLTTGCVKDTEGEEKEPEKPANFIPEKGYKYEYRIEQLDGSSATATRWISGEQDSLSYHVYNLRTEVAAQGSSIFLNDRIFSASGKTFTEQNVPEVWQQYIDLLKMMPGVTVLETRTTGYPCFITMENTIKEGSKIEISGPASQSQYIRSLQNGKQQEITQTLTIIPGTSKVETIKVGAGTFVCNRYQYTISKEINTKTDGQSYLSTGLETVTIWMAHGTGMVKSYNEGVLLTVVMLPDGPKAITTNTNSTTTLQKIQ